MTRKRVVTLAVVVGFVVLLVAVLWLFAPGLDETVGLMTGRALSLVRNHKQGGSTIGEIIAAQYKNVRWRAYHRDYLGETYVRCEAVDKSGTPVTMVWVVMTTAKRKGMYIDLATVTTAHTVSAYNVSPSLYQAGHTLYRSPDFANW